MSTAWADAYLLGLVRHIHLNPVRAGKVTDLDALAGYRGTDIVK
ncbi:hypothetical protein [uncultured Desulfuromonas sp.]|nr:hypothetical protein [uncultured Desulfuromonas sp.]